MVSLSTEKAIKSMLQAIHLPEKVVTNLFSYSGCENREI